MGGPLINTVGCATDATLGRGDVVAGYAPLRAAPAKVEYCATHAFSVHPGKAQVADPPQPMGLSRGGPSVCPH
jgi:hypothetical protein